MKKTYQVPEVELISLIAQEPITAKGDLSLYSGDSDIIDGSTGVEDNIFG